MFTEAQRALSARVTLVVTSIVRDFAGQVFNNDSDTSVGSAVLGIAIEVLHNCGHTREDIHNKVDLVWQLLSQDSPVQFETEEPPS